ncbi:MAG: isoleucine--tRNA ligase [bacterium]|nr:isoleucine--tRNA ligase [bacterium]
MSFKPVDPTRTLQQLEEETIESWKVGKTFEKSVEMRPEENSYVFVDGPPFVTGSPHYGNLLPSVAKDVIPRYQTMKGKRVRRVWGWDCHGLPIEEKVNKLFGIRSSTELERKMGVEKYVQECRKYVESASSDWRWYIERIGRWVDMDNAYYTMHTTFMESVIWSFKQIYEKGLIYKGKRVSLFSTDTSTPVSGFEVSMDTDNYRDVEDLSIFTKFELEKELEGRKAYMVAWTTTPWTIPANFALAVNESFTYVLIEYDNQNLIVSKERLGYTFNEDESHIGTEKDSVVKIIKEYSGKELEGLTYKPIYDFFLATKTQNDFKVYLSSDVINSEGTGVLHIAPAFGEVDFTMGAKHGLSGISDIDNEGKMLVSPWEGLYLRDASPLVAEDLQHRGNLLRSENYTHRLPFYRGKNPLIYMAQDSYFINIQKIKEQMAQLNEKINWIPDNIKHGRFEQTINTSPDWCISRNRYWATIMPIWENDKGDQIIIGSLEEMAQYTNQLIKKTEDGKTFYFFEDKPMDLHRDVCDKIVLTKDGSEYHRIPEVLDCWMDSGSAPFAEYHYPFENKEVFEKAMTADFIIEYVGQVRAWFNMLLRMSTMVFGETAFKNAISTGVLAGTDGRKMSKSYGNYPDPRQTIEKYGADAFRLYFMGSPVMIGEDMNFNENDLADQVKSVLNIFWNSYKYFIMYANTTENVNYSVTPENITLLDKWIYARLAQTVNEIDSALAQYNTPKATRAIRPFIDDLSTWYIRRSRNRFAASDTIALHTLYSVLLEFSKAAAPIIPFITENIYRGLTNETSVHLTDYPKVVTLSEEQLKLLANMTTTRQIASLGQAARLQAKQPIKQPLQTVQIKLEGQHELSEEYLNIIKEELNVKLVTFVDTIDNSYVTVEEKGIQIALDTTLTEELQLEGKLREVLRALQEARKQNNMDVTDEIKLRWFSADEQINKVFEKFDLQIKSGVKAKSVVKESSADNLTQLEKSNLAVIIEQ